MSNNGEPYDKPIDSTIVFKPQQLVMLNKCIQRESKEIQLNCSDRYDTLETDVGIIADKAGSGKSYVILALIASGTIPKNTIDIRYTYGHGHFNVKCKKHHWTTKIVVLNSCLMEVRESRQNHFILSLKRWSAF